MNEDPAVLEAEGAQYDAPNQQVVRADGSAPWDEGTGGEPAGDEEVNPLDSMTKEELIEYCEERGIPYPSPGVKADIRAAIDEAEA